LADALNLTFFDDHEIFAARYNAAAARNSAVDAYRKKWKREPAGGWKGC
jgi:hypothetical protein